jgi:hypothetical protein
MGIWRRVAPDNAQASTVEGRKVYRRSSDEMAVDMRRQFEQDYPAKIEHPSDTQERESEAVESAAAVLETERLSADAQAAMLTAKLCALSGTASQMAVGLQNATLGAGVRVLAVANGIETLCVMLEDISDTAAPSQTLPGRPGPRSKARQRIAGNAPASPGSARNKAEPAMNLRPAANSSMASPKALNGFTPRETDDHGEEIPPVRSPVAGLRRLHQGIVKLTKMPARMVARKGLECLKSVLAVPKLVNSDSRFYYRWSILILMGVLYSAMAVPFGLAWESTAAVGTLTVTAAVDIAVELLFLVDIAIHFRVPYHDTVTHEPVDSKDKIRRHYLHGWFCIDAMSALPVEVASFGWVTVGGAGATSGNALRVLSAARMLKLLRLAKLARLRSLEAISREYPTQVRSTLPLTAHRITHHSYTPICR